MLDPDELGQLQGWSSASLRIAADGMSVDAITELVGLRPTASRASGGDTSFAVWVLDSDLEPTAAVEDHLYILVERVRDCRAELRRLSESATVEMWLSFSPDAGARRPSVLDAKVLGELAELGIDLVLDPYPMTGRRDRPSPAPTSETA